MSDFKVPGGEVSSVSFDPRLRFDDEVTEVTKTAGPPVDVGHAINRQFGEDGAPPIKGGDSAWVGGSEDATKNARANLAKGLSEHAKKYDAKMKLRKAQLADLIKRRKAEAKEAHKQRMADGAKRSDKVKGARKDDAKAALRTQEILRAPGSSTPSAPAPTAPEDSSAPVSTGSAPAGPDVGPADPSAK